MPALEHGVHLWRARAEVLGCRTMPAAQKSRELAARMIERLLRDYLGTLPPLLKEPRGRPYLEGCSLDFNLSHSGDWVVAAFFRLGRVGVDIEQVKSERKLRAIARRFFSADEALQVEQGPAEVFYRLWTGKEAALKMTGQGISGVLDSTLPAWNESAGRGWVRVGDSPKWPALWFEAAQGVMGAVVVNTAELPPCEFFEIG